MSTRKRANRVIAYHEAANIFPLMEGEEFDALVEDIRANGQREPIWTYQGKIIDGRNRYSAILRLQEQKVKIKPAFREWSGQGSLVDFVVSQNLHRRHLDSSQKAAAAVEIEKLLAREAARRKGGRPKAGEPKPTQKFAGVSGESRQQAAKVAGTNRQYVSDAKRIDRAAPELLKEVRDGALTIPEAKKVAELPAESRQVAVEKIKAEPTAEAKKKIARELTKRAPREESMPIYSKWYDSIMQIKVLIDGMQGYDSKTVALEIEHWSEKDKRVYANRLKDAASALARMYNELTSEEMYFDDDETQAAVQYSN